MGGRLFRFFKFGPGAQQWHGRSRRDLLVDTQAADLAFGAISETTAICCPPQSDMPAKEQILFLHDEFRSRTST